MRKIPLILSAAAVFAVVSVTAYAGDLNFEPIGGGKWIYCNNPEGIRNSDLMNDDENPPAYIMNNENLEPDLYDFLICHINTTDTDGGYGMGFGIELDVELTAVEDSEITINKAFFETVTDESFIFSDGTWAKEMNKFGCHWGLTSYLGVDLCELNGSWLYEAQSYEPVTLELKKGETVWLSDYMDGYRAVGYRKPAQIIGQLELLSGKLNFNVAAFKSGEELGDRSGFNPDASFGEYAYTRTHKGVADTQPRVSVDLEYTIDYSFKDGDTFPNMVYNQYQKDGFLTDVWCTHLNPQDDVWSKNISAESDLITLTYEDDSKLTYYGSKVKDKNKDNIWVWDAYHSDTAEYQGAVTWYNKDEYVPNYELSEKRSNQGYACSMGNYGVIESYNLKVTNKTNKDKYFEYMAETTASVAVYVEDDRGAHSGFYKGEKSPATKDTLASVLVPAESEKEFTINVILPINYVGGTRNSFCVQSKSSINKTYEDYVNEPHVEKGPVTTGVLAREVQDDLPQEVKDIIRGNYDSFELIEGNDGYMLRCIEGDGSPYYYLNQWLTMKTIYYLDEDYNIVDKYDFDTLIRLALFYDGYYYVEDADGLRYRSEDGQKWESYTHRMPLTEVTFNNSEPSAWAKDDIERAFEIDAAPYGFKDTLVYTEDMTRESFCDVLASMLELKDMLPEKGNKTFSDTKNDNVLRLAGAGIISGYNDGTFLPDNSITREEAASLLYRAADYLGYDDFYEDYRLSSFIYYDDNSISEWAKKAVYQTHKMNIMSGVGGDKFAPKGTYTNEQGIVTVMRLYDAV